MSIGTQLREAREARSLSLDQAAQATRIKLHYLDALEADKFELLPSPAQVRGFLRAYGDYLKLDTSKLIRDLDQAGAVVLKTPEPAIQPDKKPITSTNSDAIFQEVGHILQSQRELMGLSLGDVERHTHIRIHYVQALESGDIAHLPSPVQGRGMLSNYAAFLGLDTESILLRFADGLQVSLQDRQQAKEVTSPQRRKQEPGRPPAQPSPVKRLFSMDFIISGFIIVFLLGFVVWGALRISAMNSNKQPSPSAPPVSEILLSTSPASDLITSTLQSTGQVSTAPVILTGTPVASGTLEVGVPATQISLISTPSLENAPVQVYIVVHQEAWMRIDVDGEMQYEGRAIVGSAYSFAANEEIAVLTGNGAGLQIYFNQQDLGLLGSFGEVVERVYTAHGVQTATPAIHPTDTPQPTGTITPTPAATGTPIPPTPSPTPKP